MLFSVVCCHKRRHFLHIRLAVLRFSFALPVAKGSGARCPKIPSTGRNHIRISILVTCNFQCNAKERQRTQLTWLLEPHQAAAFAVAGQDLHLTKPHGNTNRTENAIGPKTHTDKICCSLPWRACLFHICMFLWLRVSQFLVGCGKLGSKGRCLKILLLRNVMGLGSRNVANWKKKRSRWSSFSRIRFIIDHSEEPLHMKSWPSPEAASCLPANYTEECEEEWRQCSWCWGRPTPFPQISISSIHHLTALASPVHPPVFAHMAHFLEENPAHD